MAQNKKPRKSILVRLPVEYYNQVAQLAEKKMNSLGNTGAMLIIETLDSRATGKGAKRNG